MFVLYGQLYSKANSRRAVVNRRTGRSMYIKSQGALECVLSMRAQAQQQWVGNPLTGNIRLTAIIHYSSLKPDCDESLLMDLLQDICYVNDRQISDKRIKKRLDRDNPRVEVTVELDDYQDIQFSKIKK